MKIMDKQHIIREKKVPYVKLEKMILDKLDHPGVVRLCFTFQDEDSLCIPHPRIKCDAMQVIIFLCSQYPLESVSLAVSFDLVK